MIGKPEWFNRRKYTGWGLNPKTWQGWVYIACFIFPFILVQSVLNLSTSMRISVTVVWLFILLIDVIDIMRKMKLDEREKIHEAIAERNALWGIMVVLIFGILYDLVTNALNEKVYVNPFIMAALIVALLIKSLSNYILGRKN